MVLYSEAKNGVLKTIQTRWKEREQEIVIIPPTFEVKEQVVIEEKKKKFSPRNPDLIWTTKQKVRSRQNERKWHEKSIFIVIVSLENSLCLFLCVSRDTHSYRLREARTFEKDFRRKHTANQPHQSCNLKLFEEELLKTNQLRFAHVSNREKKSYNFSIFV